jgi:two-component system, chemotaxis family, protein-glutamate methylesterase/glutaminase
VPPRLAGSVVVIGASAGGVEALKAVVGGLPEDLPAAVVVVLHLPRKGPQMLPVILAKAGCLRSVPAQDWVTAVRGVIYVAPPDRHVVLVGGRMRLTSDVPANGHRPSIDVLFRSAARTYGPRAVGVVLSGDGGDGASGLQAIVDRGGMAVVQEPGQAAHSSMPHRALERVPQAEVRRAEDIGPAVTSLIRIGTPAAGTLPTITDDCG